MENKTDDKDRIFSIELKSRSELRNITLTDSDSALIEGTIGRLIHATFTEGIILEVIGEGGSLRVDLNENEIQKTTERVQSEANEH